MEDGWTRAIDKLHHQAWTAIQQSYRHQTDLERGPNNKIKIKQQNNNENNPHKEENN